MNRSYPSRPIVAVGGLIFQGESALLVKRAKEPGLGRWSIPGGAVEKGETLAEALAREMAEETSLDVEAGPLVEAIERIFRDEANEVLYHYVVLDYLCRVRSGKLQPGSDASEARFVPPDQWPEYKLPSITIEVLNKALAMARNLYKEG